MRRGLTGNPMLDGNLATIGTPEEVAEQFHELNEAGMSGAILGFLDYAKELQEFGADGNLIIQIRAELLSLERWVVRSSDHSCSTS